MKKKVLCIALALLMCMMVAVPAFADGEVETLPYRAPITASFGLTQISGSTYRMVAIINNPLGVSVNAKLTLYNISYSPVASIVTTSSSTIFSISKNVCLSSGTYHLILTYTADGSTFSFEKTYAL